MSELSPRAQSLIRQSRSELRATDDDRERVRAALRVRLGQALIAGDALAAAATKSPALWPLAPAAFVGLGILGGALAVAFQWQSDVPTAQLGNSAPAVVLPAPVPNESPLMAPSAPSAAPPTVPRDATNSPRLTAPARPVDRLAEEVAILSRAARHLRSGRAAEALDALNEHQSKFPSGALVEERRAAKAEALCSLGRFSAAEAELARIFRSSPQSPLGIRARELCAARSPGFKN